MLSKIYSVFANIFFTSASVRLYGTKEEFEAVFKKGYLEQNILNTNFSKIGWLKAAKLTKKLKNKNFNPKDFSKKARLKDIRVVGAGIQNAASTAELVLFLRNALLMEGVQLITFFILPEEKSNYIQGMRSSLKGKNFNFGSSERVRFNLPSKTIARGVLINKNMSSPYCNVVNGCRVNSKFVVGDEVDKKILFFGASEVFGTGLIDSQTISANYQTLLGGASSTVCLNFGMGGVNFIDIVALILKTNKIMSDTVFLAVPYSESMSHVDLIIQLQQSDMIDYSHPNEKGAKKVANALFDYVQSNRSHRFAAPLKREVSIPCLDVYRTYMMACEALEVKTGALKNDLEYFNAVREKYVSENLVVGSVAVNCNPITLGHEYLIDYAKSKVDVLFVLLIEEDLSAVSFEDRYELVSMVCENKHNVFVLRGGAFVCTEFISPEYFIKDDLRSEVVDFSLESFYFGQYIGPALGVQKIFLGDEPKCPITNQYNEHMKLAMPAYGIELDIIPRISNADGDVISASFVRQLIGCGDYEQLYHYVPSICIPYLSAPSFKLRSDEGQQS